jgi:hypothetical protein
MTAKPEVWLRGPVPGITSALQPVAHSLMQSAEEVHRVTAGLTGKDLWSRPGDIASIGYHLRHAAGALDRLFTYARGDALSDAQRSVMLAESKDDAEARPSLDELLRLFDDTVAGALAQLRTTEAEDLDGIRLVGRAQLPSHVRGLLFHAAEHTYRHVGQLTTTAKLVRAGMV